MEEIPEEEVNLLPSSYRKQQQQPDREYLMRLPSTHTQNYHSSIQAEIFLTFINKLFNVFFDLAQDIRANYFALKRKSDFFCTSAWHPVFVWVPTVA